MTCRAVGVSLCCVVDMVVEYTLINKYINRIAITQTWQTRTGLDKLYNDLKSEMTRLYIHGCDENKLNAA